MKTLTPWLLLCLTFPNAGCAQDNEAASSSIPVKPMATVQSKDTQVKVAPATTTLETKMLAQRALLVRDTAHAGSASLFATAPISSERLADWIVNILQAQGASAAFVEKLAPRLKMNPRLQKDNFSLPIIDEQGKQHHFEYSSNYEYDFYTLNYKNTENGE